jgi:hypothetical protein
MPIILNEAFRGVLLSLKENPGAASVRSKPLVSSYFRIHQLSYHSTLYDHSLDAESAVKNRSIMPQKTTDERRVTTWKHLQKKCFKRKYGSETRRELEAASKADSNVLSNESLYFNCFSAAFQAAVGADRRLMLMLAGDSGMFAIVRCPNPS